MKIDTKNLIPVTKLQKELTKQIRMVSEGNGPIFVLKNNEMQAVIIDSTEYEKLMEYEEIIEYLEISKLIKDRLKNYKQENSISWDEIK